MRREPVNSATPLAMVVNDDPTQLNVLSGLVGKRGRMLLIAVGGGCHEH